MGTLASHDVVFGRRHDIIDMMPEGVRANKVPETLGTSKYPEKNKKLVLEPEPRENFGITQKWSLRRMSEFVTVILMHPSQTYYR